MHSFQKETLTQLQQDFRDSQAEERRLAEKMEQCKKAVASYRTAEKDLKVKLQRADELADRLTDELTAETPQIGQIESFENIILEKEAEKEMQEAALQDAQEARAKWAPTLRTAKNELRVLEEEVNEVEAQINKATAKTSKLRQERESALMQKNEAIETLKFAEREKEGVIADRQEQATTVANFIRGASEVSLRVPVDANETYDSLQKKWERLKKDKEISEAR
jgi:chromosome segregation ATPase